MRPVFERVRVIEIRRAASHGVVDVTHASGRQGRAAAERASGHPGSPLTDEARLAKVWSLYEHPGRPVPESVVLSVIDLVGRFEEVARTTELTSLLASR